ncbi:hypothetical protein HBB16_04635 [Pseudonocardia sp. MCCB 268]|nr:hypothetical protein [Pseudonocardia cytotoxica]
MVTYRYRLPRRTAAQAEADLSDSDIAVPGRPRRSRRSGRSTRSQYRRRGSAGHGCSGRGVRRPSVRSPSASGALLWGRIMNLYGSAQAAIGVLLCIVAVVGAGRMLRELRDMPDWPAVTGRSACRDEDPRVRGGHAGAHRPLPLPGQERRRARRPGTAAHRPERRGRSGRRVQVNPRDPAQSRPVAAPRSVVIGFTVFCGALGVAGLTALLSRLARVFPT